MMELFSEKDSESIPIGDLSPKQFLAIATEAIDELNWDLTYIKGTNILAKARYNEDYIGDIAIGIIGTDALIRTDTEQICSDFFDSFREVKANFPIDMLTSKFEELKSMYAGNNELEEEEFKEMNESTPKRFIDVFVPHKGYFITPLLVYVNVVVFILMVISGLNFFKPEGIELLSWGANSRSVTLDGQWWRLISHCFIHIGFIHLIFNMAALIYIGLSLEPYLGKTRFLAAYILTGIAAGLASLTWHEETVSAGASGAIFGMFGVFLSLLTTDIVDRNIRSRVLITMVYFVIYNLADGFLKGGVDNAAHIGGLASGIAIGYAYYPLLNRPAENLKPTFVIVGILSFILLVYTFIISIQLGNDMSIYHKKMEEFTTNEKKALQVYNLPKDAPKSLILSELKDTGLHYWNKNASLINEVEKLRLTDKARSMDMRLFDYCQLRIKDYKLIYQAINDNDTSTKSQIIECNEQIEKSIDELTSLSNTSQNSGYLNNLDELKNIQHRP